MKTALITTTINTPHVLKFYQRCAAANFKNGGFRIFVAGDLKTPELYDSFVPDMSYIPPKQQERWQVSQHLPWSSITRRNIALLEALQWGAEVIVTIDDDNIPIDRSYFDHFSFVMESPFDGLSVTTKSGWFDVGQMVFPTASHRGFPHEKASPAKVGFCTDTAIGVCAGIVLGDPDISAVTRIANHPETHVVSEVLRAGAVVDLDTWTVFNTQNTAVTRQFAPALLCCPQFGRYDDIFASLICQRMMREQKHHVHFGQPLVWQQRNPHDLNVDLENEVFGMKHVVHLAGVLDHIYPFYVDQHPVRTMYDVISKVDWCPPGVDALANAWMDDVESVL